MNQFHPQYLEETARRINLQPYPDTRQLVIQHLYPDTLRLLLLLHQYVPILAVIGIGYSGNRDVVEQLAAAGIRVITPDYKDLQQTVKSELNSCLTQCRSSACKLIIHEVGGYGIRSLHEHYAGEVDQVAGVIEVTKQGVWQAQQLPSLLVPQVNCAQTRLKEIEGKMVGEAVVTALDVILRELGYAIVGRSALVLGYGWVGRGTAASLKQRGMQVSVFDTDTIKQVEATVDGYTVPATDNHTTTAKIVIGASGAQSIGASLIDQLPHRTFIASGASKDHEIDLPYLQQNTEQRTTIHQHIDALTMKDGRTLFLVNQGFPVNFTGSSVPDEIVEFLFAELIMLVPMLLDQTLVPGIYPLPLEQERIAAQVWLDLR